ncbi:GNAT family acetyltransferase [Branchiibius hedensis]|uniref:Acetyltransferase (GNAT) family protein n=1 Tax=Branchiibius hedensis TaxID=672460 RepID=A0A2Y9BUC8_9MICO|nr:GNAT family N-acetyltransferase [Branchiibius hedensis]PWJ26711.1 GNAT family acetyltransferase [Branchiibius hedensis]SSA35522.1 Acetyltransferase (GNAT) family protein [Branchiibius hedensis]
MANLPSLTLTPASDDELVEFIAQQKVSYLRDLIEQGGLSEAAAQANSDATWSGLVPDGIHPIDGNEIMIARDVDGQRIGVLWMSVRSHGDEEYAWIYDIEVDPQVRNRGYGRALMLAAEEWTRQKGLTSLQLNVFGGNTAARALYRSLGFVENAVQMSKQV